MSQDGAVPTDSGTQEGRDQEAQRIAIQREAELRRDSYETLVAKYQDRTVRDEVVGATGSV